MFPIFVPSSDSEDSQHDLRWRKLIGLGLGTAVALSVGVGLLLARTGAIVGMPVWGIATLIMVLALVGLFVISRESGVQKRKRGLDGLDMYTLIDRMVDDLDKDEMAYLQQRLAQKEHNLPEQMADLLDQREEARQAGRR
jgi:hypothetical protein